MNTWLLEFRFKPKDLVEKKDEIVSSLKEILDKPIPGCKIAHVDLNGSFTVFLTSHFGANVLLQGTDDGVVTIDINIPKEKELLSEDVIKELANKIKDLPSAVRAETPDVPPLPCIRRGAPFSRYENNCSRLVERDFDRVVFDEVTPHQHIRIFHSPQYGNVCYVDNDLNIAEGDWQSYCHGATGSGKEDFTNKTVLILGGGDGAVLRYLLDKNPAMVTAVDIDEVLIDVSKKFLQGLCHDVLDSLKGENYEVIIDDCLNQMRLFAEEGRKFDYVINEITYIPVQRDCVDERWEFIFTILASVLKVLKKDGKYFTHGTSPLHAKDLALFEKRLKDFDPHLKHERNVTCIPSYLENLVFYTIWKDANNRD